MNGAAIWQVTEPDCCFLHFIFYKFLLCFPFKCCFLWAPVRTRSNLAEYNPFLKMTFPIHFFSSGAKSRIQTLDLRIMSQVFDHFATTTGFLPILNIGNAICK